MASWYYKKVFTVDLAHFIIIKKPCLKSSWALPDIFHEVLNGRKSNRIVFFEIIVKTAEPIISLSITSMRLKKDDCDKDLLYLRFKDFH